MHDNAPEPRRTWPGTVESSDCSGIAKGDRLHGIYSVRFRPLRRTAWTMTRDPPSSGYSPAARVVTATGQPHC